jgi:hypothetical protein
MGKIRSDHIRNYKFYFYFKHVHTREFKQFPTWYLAVGHTALAGSNHLITKKVSYKHLMLSDCEVISSIGHPQGKGCMRCRQRDSVQSEHDRQETE